MDTIPLQIKSKMLDYQNPTNMKLINKQFYTTILTSYNIINYFWNNYKFRAIEKFRKAYKNVKVSKKYIEKKLVSFGAFVPFTFKTVYSYEYDGYTVTIDNYNENFIILKYENNLLNLELFKLFKNDIRLTKSYFNFDTHSIEYKLNSFCAIVNFDNSGNTLFYLNTFNPNPNLTYPSGEIQLSDDILLIKNDNHFYLYHFNNKIPFLFSTTAIPNFDNLSFFVINDTIILTYINNNKIIISFYKHSFNNKFHSLIINDISPYKINNILYVDDYFMIEYKNLDNLFYINIYYKFKLVNIFDLREYTLQKFTIYKNLFLLEIKLHENQYNEHSLLIYYLDEIKKIKMNNYIQDINLIQLNTRYFVILYDQLYIFTEKEMYVLTTSYFKLKIIN